MKSNLKAYTIGKTVSPKQYHSLKLELTFEISDEKIIENDEQFHQEIDHAEHLLDQRLGLIQKAKPAPSKKPKPKKQEAKQEEDVAPTGAEALFNSLLALRSAAVGKAKNFLDKHRDWKQWSDELVEEARNIVQNAISSDPLLQEKPTEEGKDENDEEDDGDIIV